MRIPNEWLRELTSWRVLTDQVGSFHNHPDTSSNPDFSLSGNRVLAGFRSVWSLLIEQHPVPRYINLPGSTLRFRAATSEHTSLTKLGVGETADAEYSGDIILTSA